MSERASLEREARAFTHYLIGRRASDYVIGKYVEAHAVQARLAGGGRADAMLVRLAVTGAGLARVADAYARFFAPHSLLRKKLVLLLAILETCAPSYRDVEHVPGGGLVLTFIRLIGVGLVAALALFLGVSLLLVLHKGLAWSERRPAEAGV